MSNFVGWIIWSVLVIFCVTWAYQSYTYWRTIGVNKITVMQTVYFWLLAIYFAFSSTSKLHILWLVPAGFLAVGILWTAWNLSNKFGGGFTTNLLIAFKGLLLAFKRLFDKNTDNRSP